MPMLVFKAYKKQNFVNYYQFVFVHGRNVEELVEMYIKFKVHYVL